MSSLPPCLTPPGACSPPRTGRPAIGPWIGFLENSREDQSRLRRHRLTRVLDPLEQTREILDARGAHFQNEAILTRDVMQLEHLNVSSHGPDAGVPPRGELLCITGGEEGGDG